MKRIVIVLLALLVIGGSSEAYCQSWVEQLGKNAVNRAKNRAKETVENKINRKVDETVDGAFEKAEDAVKGNKKDNKGKQQTEQEHRDAQIAAQEAARAEIAREEEKAVQEETPKKPEPKNLELAYAKSDFVRGDEVFFEDNLVGEQLGEFPSKWDLLDGVVEVAKLNGENVITKASVGAEMAPFFEDMHNYLPEKFTLEFDFWCADYVKESEWYAQDAYKLFFYDKERDKVIEFGFVSESRSDEIKGEINVRYSAAEKDYRNSGAYITNFQAGEWNHFALSFNQRSLKIYINGVRYINIPRVLKPNYFSFIFDNWGGYNPSNPSIKNIILAKGAVPLYDRMMTDGKFITYGITFDVGKSVIKPESMGEINRIVQLMNENPTLKFSVEGHTDATGNAASNQTLSEARANAIVDKLVENGIARDRLTAVGKGQNSPIADNSTDEGRAKNRRVEFVKQ